MRKQVSYEKISTLIKNYNWSFKSGLKLSVSFDGQEDESGDILKLADNYGYFEKSFCKRSTVVKILTA